MLTEVTPVAVSSKTTASPLRKSVVPPLVASLQLPMSFHQSPTALSRSLPMIPVHFGVSFTITSAIWLPVSVSVFDSVREVVPSTLPSWMPAKPAPFRLP